MEVAYENFDCTLETLEETLEQHGVAVLPDVLDVEEIGLMREGMWSMLGTITKNFATPITPEPRTWGQYFALQPMRHSMLHDFKVGHAQVAWDVRQNPRVAGAFAKLWRVAPEDLLTSTDGMAIHFPPEAIAAAAREEERAKIAKSEVTANKGEEREEADEDDDPVYPGGPLANSYYRGGDWFHTDQAPGRPELSCVQGLVTAYDMSDGDGTLAVLRGSNKHFAAFASQFGLQGHTAVDWCSIRDESRERSFFDERGCKRVNVRARAGSLVLWDSRTVHCGCLPQRGRPDPKIRFVVYVCMKPLPFGASERAEALKRKREILANRKTSSHWPDGRATFDAYMKTATNGAQIGALPQPNLTPLGRLLAGDRPDDSDTSEGGSWMCVLA
eukprot:m.94830 g.94830  ORF g.94830 m.94830 type:complete len:387 (-) comp13877_c0_seq1:21-1181(-)